MPQGGVYGQPVYQTPGRSRGSFPQGTIVQGSQPVPFPTQPGFPQGGQPSPFPTQRGFTQGPQSRPFPGPPGGGRPVSGPSFNPQPRWQAAPQSRPMGSPYYAQGRRRRPQGRSQSYDENIPPPPSEVGSRPTRKLIFRGQSPEEREDEEETKPAPRRVSLSLPPPSALGIKATARETVSAEPVRIDWNTAWASYKKLGASGFRLDRLSSGRYRIQFAVPTGTSRRTHPVEGTGVTELAAMSQALAQGARAANGR